MAAKVAIHKPSGIVRCGCCKGWANCRRQRHKVHSAKGQAGQLNQVSKRAKLAQSRWRGRSNATG